MHKIYINKSYLILGLIILLSLFLAVFHNDGILFGGDIPGHFLASARLAQTAPFSSDLLHNFFAQLLSFRHGPVTQLIPFLWLKLLAWFGFPFTEFNINLIQAIFAAVTLIAIFFLGRILFDNESIALLSVFLVAITPNFIGIARRLEGDELFSIFFSCVIVLIFALIAKKSRQQNVSWKFFALAGVILFLGFGTSQLLLFLPLILPFLAMEINNSADSYSLLRKYWLGAKKLFGHVMFIFPALLICAYSFIFLAGRFGFLPPFGFFARVVQKASTGARFSFASLLSDSLIYFGAALAILFIFMLSYFFYKCLKRKCSSQEKFLLTWISIFLAFIIFINKGALGHVQFIIVPLAILSAYFLVRVLPRIISIPTGLAVAAITLFFVAVTIFRLPVFGTTAPYYYGSVIGNNGVRALGYYMRHDILPSHPNFRVMYQNNSSIFFAYEGIEYYIGAKTLKDLDKLSQAKMIVVMYPVAFAKTPYGIGSGFSMLQQSAKQFALNNNFYKAASIMLGNAEGIAVFSKESLPYVKIDIAEGDKLFEKNYENLNSLSDLYLGLY